MVSRSGKTLVISATGVLHDVVAQGAYVDIVVKYGVITLIKKTFDLCENAGQVDLECPVDQGKLILEKSVDLPAAIPPVSTPIIMNKIEEKSKLNRTAC